MDNPDSREVLVQYFTIFHAFKELAHTRHSGRRKQALRPRSNVPLYIRGGIDTNVRMEMLRWRVLAGEVLL